MNMEDRKVLCPYCKELGVDNEMTPYDPTNSLLRLVGPVKRRATYQCPKCGAQTPIKEGDTYEEAKDLAYTAATKRNTNRMLTFSELQETMPILGWVVMFDGNKVADIEQFYAETMNDDAGLVLDDYNDGHYINQYGKPDAYGESWVFYVGAMPKVDEIESAMKAEN
jgi:hypothetical protein